VNQENFETKRRRGREKVHAKNTNFVPQVQVGRGNTQTVEGRTNWDLMKKKNAEGGGTKVPNKNGGPVLTRRLRIQVLINQEWAGVGTKSGTQKVDENENILHGGAKGRPPAQNFPTKERPRTKKNGEPTRKKKQRSGTPFQVREQPKGKEN